MRVLAEHQILSALHVAEAVRLKVDVINGLRRRIEQRELETAIRDYIAKHPWLISPRWETFQVERRIGKLVADAIKTSGIDSDADWNGRVDLILSSGHELLVLEFMRPGLSVDRDHIDRFQRYIDILRSRVRANSSLELEKITGMAGSSDEHVFQHGTRTTRKRSQAISSEYREDRGISCGRLRRETEET